MSEEAVLISVEKPFGVLFLFEFGFPVVFL